MDELLPSATQLRDTAVGKGWVDGRMEVVHINKKNNNVGKTVKRPTIEKEAEDSTFL